MTATLYKFIDNTVGLAAEVNANTAKHMTLTGLNTIRSLIDRAGVWSKGNIDGWGDAYIDADGREGSVTGGTATFVNDGTFKPLVAGATEASPAPTGTGNASYDGLSGTINTDGIFTKVQFIPSQNLTYTVSITKNAVGVASKSVGGSSGSLATVNFTTTDYSLLLANGDTFGITIGGGQVYRGTGISFDGTNFDYGPTQSPNRNGGGDFDFLTFTPYTTSSAKTIVHTIPAGTFPATMSKAILVPLLQNWETGADITYTLTNAVVETTGTLTCSNTPALSSFTAFTSQPTTLTITLTPKSSSPTFTYPSLKGFWVYGE
jgi:hypothetical protein